MADTNIWMYLCLGQNVGYDLAKLALAWVGTSCMNDMESTYLHKGSWM